MGYSGKLREKNLAQVLRKQGLSYAEILTRIKVSKSTISLWCRDIAISPHQALRLYKKKLTGAARGRAIGAKVQQLRRIKETITLLKNGKKEVGRMSKRDRFIAGIAFYAAEGTKHDRVVGFINSDPKLIKFMVSWFKEFCTIEDSRLKGRLWIHDNKDEKQAKKFWSRLAGIPLKQFNKSYITKNKVQSKKIRKQIHKYGVFSVGVSHAKTHRKIMGWIAGITSF